MRKYDSSSRIQHRFKSFILGKPKFLILGSFPTTDNRISFEFYYSSASNRFWKTLNRIFPDSKNKIEVKVSRYPHIRFQTSFAPHKVMNITNSPMKSIQIHST